MIMVGGGIDVRHILSLMELRPIADEAIIKCNYKMRRNCQDRFEVIIWSRYLSFLSNG